MGMTTDPRPAWRTSSRSNGTGGACVEVADNLPGRVLVRDSKDRTGGTLTFSPTAWRTFVDHHQR
ncbi:MULTISPECIES: DUF397 domain-containing protein [unclassified Solwaraspora]|uniref:DUF397 domain-containing protein n=1 Tax=unclassified Solwaraspora TaxID=2627926 RepID=UPI00248C31B0|nr:MULTISPECIES: DUF397 domain-containing protein [unclassified Solwaraspora]WBB98394.1 DUF397 domain-containing protein [Solwaraspora sp. WMMA2059]WBC23053.1 DUF397 domain-containing protein [Solwaraspora sp. WMMA2080]WJK34913.1 DUF397 domain-containing protein [Solwaraspora sp. WMMA2065]